MPQSPVDELYWLSEAVENLMFRRSITSRGHLAKLIGVSPSTIYEVFDAEWSAASSGRVRKRRSLVIMTQPRSPTIGIHSVSDIPLGSNSSTGERLNRAVSRRTANMPLPRRSRFSSTTQTTSSIPTIRLAPSYAARPYFSV